MAPPRKVWFSHDGGLDDFHSIITLTSDPTKVELLGITVIEGVCLVDSAVAVTKHLLDIMHHPDVPVTASSAEPRNPFPMNWRAYSINCADLPALHTDYADRLKTLGRHDVAREEGSGEDYMAKCIMEAEGGVTLVATGPLTDVAYCIDKYGESFTSKVDELIVMGGALDVPGNAPIPDGTGVAEWNFYWDPPSAGKVLRSAIPIVLFSLDATDTIPITHDFVRKFGPLSRRYPAAEFAGSMWALVTHAEVAWGHPMYMWDVLACAYLFEPSLCQMVEERIAVDVEGENQGRTRRDDEGGALVKVARNVDRDRFYDLVLRDVQSISYE